MRTLTQKAQALIGLNNGKDVPPIVHELMVRYPALVDAAQSSLLLGQSFLRMRDKAAEGVALLKKVVAEHPASVAAVVAQYDLIGYELDQGVTAGAVESLVKWINANAQHPLNNAARQRLVNAYLALADLAGPAAHDAGLSKEDAAALAAASDLYAKLPWAAEADQLTQRILAHLGNRYLKKQAYAAAVAGADALLKAPLPKSSRRLALGAAASYRAELALYQLNQGIASTGGGDLKTDLPLPLANTVAAFDAINQEYPSEGAWQQQAQLAERVRQLAAPISWPSKPAALKAPLAWAVQIALPVVKANADDAAIAPAATTISAIVSEVSALKDPEGRTLAAAASCAAPQCRLARQRGMEQRHLAADRPRQRTGDQ